MSNAQMSLPGSERKRNDGQHACRVNNQYASTSQRTAHSQGHAAAVVEPSVGRQHAEANLQLNSHCGLEQGDAAAKPKQHRNKFKPLVHHAALQTSEVPAASVPTLEVQQAAQSAASQLPPTAEHAGTSGAPAHRKRKRRVQMADGSNILLPHASALASAEAKWAPALQQSLPTTTAAPSKGAFWFACKDAAGRNRIPLMLSGGAEQVRRSARTGQC